MEDFKHLIDEAHKRDIKVILEMVTNYVGETNDIVTDNPDWLDGQATDENIPWMEDVNVLDQSNASVAEYLTDVSDYWMDETDIDGFKLHAADEIGRASCRERV